MFAEQFLFAELYDRLRPALHDLLLLDEGQIVLHKRVAVEGERILHRHLVAKALGPFEMIYRFPITFIGRNWPEAVQPPATQRQMEYKVRIEHELVVAPQVGACRIDIREIGRASCRERRGQEG